MFYIKIPPIHILRCASSRTSFKGGDAMVNKGGDAMVNKGGDVMVNIDEHHNLI